jgi:hypothetical protein
MNASSLGPFDSGFFPVFSRAGTLKVNGLTRVRHAHDAWTVHPNFPAYTLACQGIHASRTSSTLNTLIGGSKRESDRLFHWGSPAYWSIFQCRRSLSGSVMAGSSPPSAAGDTNVDRE